MNEEDLAQDEFAKELVYGHYKHVHIASFAKDLVLFGMPRVVEVCDAHKVDVEDFKAIMELPLFKKEMRELRALVEASPNALIQLKARNIVEQGLEEIQRIIHTGEKDSDRIKAMEFVAKIGGVFEVGRINSGDSENKNQASGLVLNVNLGPNGLIPPLPTERRPLRRVKEVMEVIDVKPER